MQTATGKVLVLIHGLCMNDLQWHSHADDGTPVDHGSVLAATLATRRSMCATTRPHTSQNGRQLSQAMEQLVKHWPVPVDEITVLATAWVVW